METQYEGFIKSIAFATGKVAFLGYKENWDGDPVYAHQPPACRFMSVIREPAPCFAAAQQYVYDIPFCCGFALEEDLISYYSEFDEEEFPLTTGVAEIISSLASCGLLTRHQELAAYVAFDVAYNNGEEAS